MSFFDDVKYRSVAGKALGYSAIIFGGECVFIEGIKRVVTVSGERMEFSLGKKLITVLGEGLTLEELETETAIVRGRVRSVGEE